MSYLIKDTTKEERERIVEDAIGNIEGACDGCAPGLAEMYQEYIDGKMELSEVNMAFTARYYKAMTGPMKEDGGCRFAATP